MKKSFAKNIALALSLAVVILFSAFPSAADDYVKLEGRAKQEYISSTLASLYRRTAANANVKRPPFTAPEGYSYEKKSINGAKYEQLTPNEKKTEKVLVQMHGGGYMLPLGNIYRKLAVKQSELAGGAEVFILDYRIAPVHHHPAALEDAVALYKHLLAQGHKSENIIFIGDSAGGNLALAAALYIRDNNMPKPGALILISPWGDVGNSLPSRVYNFKKDMILGVNLSPVLNEVPHTLYANGSDEKESYLSPVYAETFEKLPPMLIQAGSYETLFDDAAIIAARAEADGAAVQFTVYSGMPHDFALLLPEMQESQDSFEEIRDFIAKTVNPFSQ